MKKRIVSLIMSLLILTAAFLMPVSVMAETDTPSEQIVETETEQINEPVTESETETEAVKPESDGELPAEDDAAPLIEDEPEQTITFKDPVDPFAPTLELESLADIPRAGGVSLRSTGVTAYLAIYDMSYSYSFPTSAPAPWNGRSASWERIMINEGGTYKFAYCVQPRTRAQSGIQYTSSDTWAEIENNATKKDLIRRVLIYGFNGTSKYGGSMNDEYMATQAMVWAIVSDIYGTSYETTFANTVLGGNPDAIPVYNKIKAQMQSHTTIPSFSARTSGSAPTQTARWTGSQYELTLTDTRGVLPYFNLSVSGGGSYSKNGNTLKITTTNPNDLTVTMTKVRSQYLSSLVEYSPQYWLNSNYQTAMTYQTKGYSDPVKAYLKVDTEKGTLSITKTADDNEVGGIAFTVTGNGFNGTVKTNDEGIATLSVPVGEGFIVTEQTPDRYFPTDPQEFDSIPGETTELTFHNRNKEGYIKIIKLDAENNEYRLKNAVFEIYRGGELVTTLTTDENGEATSDVLLGGTYQVKEIVAPEGFNKNENTFTVDINEDGAVFEVNCEDELQRGALKIIKTFEDGRTVKFEGVAFRIVGEAAGGEQYNVDEVYYTDENGEILVEGLPVGTYKVYELEGEVNEPYILRPEEIVEVEYDKTSELEVYNVLKKGYIDIRKGCSLDGHRLTGAVYGLYNAETDELIETLTTDADRYVRSSLLIWGDYYLLEEKAPSGYYLDTQKHYVSIRDDMKVESVDLKDEPKIGSLIFDYDGRSAPRTGDRAALPVAITALVLSAALITLISVVSIKRKGER